MEVNLLSLRKSINKAYLKVKPERSQIETFKKNIISLYDQINESESEEFHKNIISEFLKNTWYSPDHYINTKGRADLVIHNGKNTTSPVGVIFETKKPGNKPEMPTTTNLNTRAFHELILYFMRERIKGNNLEVKNLIITNIFEWFIFNTNDFERLFASDKNLVKQFTDFEERRLSGLNTDFFYKNIAEPFVENLESQISVTYFDIRDFETIIKNNDKQDDNKLIALYKILSPEHLLKLPFANDSNNLDKTFYNELLHIIGLEETKEGSKKLIGRKKTEKRNQASLIENVITILKSEDCLSQLPKRSDFGNDSEEQLFNVALELGITWINRILFLKLLEGQLVRYNNGDKAFRFLNTGRVHDYDELNKLFFQVLAVKEGDRNEKIKEKFGNIPYLNSSLFEPNDLEHKTIRISNLDDHFKLPVLSNTVLKDKTGKKLTGEIDPIQYLFEFLDSYDFSSEGSEDIQEENKTLINASVLGLIFEKINGYKDGSFFTPGFITMYMCHETIRRAVVQKFNEAKGWKCETINNVYNKIEDIEEANKIINSLRICDPAVGSGHFLVSALNEIIAIKSELKILTDREGKKLKEYTIEVINDELIITDEQSKLFEYNPKSKESQRVQEALFQEKQKIIENCLFGVDINPNSVKICRLRLWIELLKNAYYKHETSFPQLETLPNIDINIKCGNSLISRYPLDADIKTALKSSKWNVDNYREAVMTYRNAQSKDEKRSMEQLISKIKNDFETEVSKSDKRFLKLNKLNGELLSLTGQSSLFELTKTQKDEWNRKVKKLTEEIKKYETEIEEIKNNKIYENAFEWRFEFPEVLNNDGDFIGFDVVLGNPPYVNIEDITWNNRRFFETIYKCATGRFDLYSLFIEKSLQIKAASGAFAFIIPGKFLNNKQFVTARKFVCTNRNTTVVKIDDKVFNEAQVDSVIISNYLPFQTNHLKYNSFRLTSIELQKLSETEVNSILMDKDAVFRLEINTELDYLILKIEEDTIRLREIAEVKDGIVAGTIKDLLFLEKKLDKDSHKLYFGKHISRFHLAETEVWVNYKLEEMMKQEIKRKGDKRTGLWMRDKKIFEREKIIYRKVGKELIATLAEKGIYYEQTIHSCHITDKRVRTKFVLGLFNSKLYKFYYRKTNSQGGDIFPQVRISSVENLPIKIADNKTQDKIEKFVDQILAKKEKNVTADTIALETEIDRLVYELYGLTEEDIRIVEGKL
ncbi:MAG: TaqI-like C-terminal specificity domain-containing protein [Bacteroidales bacterium]